MSDQKAEKTYEPLVIGRVRGVIVDSGITSDGNRFAIKARVTKADGERAKNTGKHSLWTGGFAGEGMKYTMETLEALGFDLAKMELKDFHPEQLHAGKEFEFEISHYKLPAKDGKPERTQDQIKYFVFEGRGGGLGKMKLDGAESKNASDVLMARMKAHKETTTEDGTATSGAPPAEFGREPDKNKDTLPF